MGFLLPLANVLLLVLMFIRRIDGQCNTLPCFSQVPSNPTYGIAGRDILLPWNYNAESSVAVNFQKWSILDKDGKIELNILQKSSSGFTEAVSYKGRTEFVENAGIILKKLNISDERYYQTTIDFSDGKAIVHEVFLNITVLPTLKATLPSEVVAKEAESISFSCEAEARPPPTIIWQLNDKTVNGSRFLVTTTVISFSAGLTQIRSTLQINSLLPEDNGILRCLVQIVTANLTSNTSLVVHYSPKNTKLSTNLPNNFVTTGGNANLICAASGLPSPYFQFYKGSTLIQNTTSNIYAISNAKTVDEAIYECVPINFLGEGPRSNLSILVRVPPTFLQRPGDTTAVLLNASVSLVCTIYGEPQPVITWEKVNGSLPSSVTISNRTVSKNATFAVTESVLTIPNAAKVDYGTYQCKGTNDVGIVTHNTVLDIQYSAEITPNFNAVTNTSETFTLYTFECLIEASPAPNVYWTRDGVLFTTGVSTSVTENLDHRTRVHTTITFPSGIKRGNYGHYSCHADNAVANVSKSTTANIWYIPEFLKNLTDRVNKTAFENVSLVCEIQGHPQPSIEWKKGNAILSTGFTTEVTARQPTNTKLRSTLTLTSVDKTETGNYVCVATNVAGTKQMATYVDVQYVPRPAQTKYDITVNSSLPFVLDCGVDSNPPVQTYHWWKNGVQQSQHKTSSISVASSSETDTGMYVCLPVNPVGPGPNVTFDLKVRYLPKVTKAVSCKLTTKPNSTRVYECVCGGVGYPTPEIRWTKFGSSKVLAMGTSLNVTVEQGIDGTYECRIQNSQGEVISNIQIIVYNDQYGQWTDYGSCNATCGGGVQTRTRTCNVLPCTSTLSETRNCNIASCGALAAKNQDELLFLYVLIPIFLFLLIFIIVWLARVNRNREDQEPIVVPVNNNLSKPPSVRSVPTKREIYLPENNFGVLNAGYRPDGDLVNGMVKKERDTVEVEMHFGNEPPESDTDPVEVALPATESPTDAAHYRNGFTPVSDLPESPDYTPVPEYDFVSPGSQRNRPQEIESWLGPTTEPVTHQNGDEDDFYTAL